MSSIFTQIRKKEVTGQDIIYEDDKVFIFLANKPHTEGHSLIMPVEEVGRFEELSPELFAYMSNIAQKYAKVLNQIYIPERIGMVIYGFEIDHVHIHIMPIWKDRGVWRSGDIPEVSIEELNKVTEKIKAVASEYLV